MLEGWLTQHGHLQTQKIEIGKHIVSGTPHNFGVSVLYMLQEYMLKEKYHFLLLANGKQARDHV